MRLLKLPSFPRVNRESLDQSIFEALTRVWEDIRDPFNSLFEAHIYPLDFFSARSISANELAGVLVGGTNLIRVNTSTAIGARLVWGAADVTEVQFAPVVIPRSRRDLPLTLNLQGLMDTGAKELTIVAMTGEGTDNLATPTTSGDFGTALETKQILIQAPTGGFEAPVSISLVCENAANELSLFGAWLDYTIGDELT